MSFKKVFSLVMVRKEKEILLGLKLRGFGVGKWNGFGGKLESNETIHQCALRELEEECGLIAKDLRQIGILEFDFVNDPVTLVVHVFDTFNFEGNIIETDEMQPKWFNLSDIPYEKMWPNNSLWFPYMFKGIPFKGYFLYQGEDLILKYKLEEVAEFPLC